MNMIKKIIKRIWVIYACFIFISLFLISYPLFRFLLSKKDRYAKANLLRRLFSKVFFLFIGIYYKIEYDPVFTKEYLKNKNKRPYVICSNHASLLDIPLIALVLRGKWRFMAKAELIKIPIFNIFFRTIDITVDRSSKNSSYVAYMKAAQSLDENFSVVIFPEAGISNIAPRLMKFKSGPFKLAIKKQVPVVPITFLDNWKLFPDDGKNLGRPGRTRVIVHQLIETSGLKEGDEEILKEKVYAILDQTLNKKYTANE